MRVLFYLLVVANHPDVILNTPHTFQILVLPQSIKYSNFSKNVPSTSGISFQLLSYSLCMLIQIMMYYLHLKLFSSPHFELSDESKRTQFLVNSPNVLDVRKDDAKYMTYLYG